MIVEDGVPMQGVVHFSERTLQHFKRVQALLDRLDPQGEPEALIVPGSARPRDAVIVFTGSFNPPTTAHLAMLQEARRYARQHEPTHLYAAISKHTVDKESVERPLLLDRIVLLQKLLRRRVPETGILLFNRGLYVDQAKAVQRSFPEVKQIFFLMGFDKIVQILDPRYYQDRDAALRDLFQRAELLVTPRGNDGQKELEDLIQQSQNRQFARYIHPLPLNRTYRDISSTQVRQRASGYQHEVPQEVQRFMRMTRAYEPPLKRTDGSEIDYYGERMKRLDALLHGSLASRG
jgi:nicotinic acid mononucleotide adenylyltransferase